MAYSAQLRKQLWSTTQNTALWFGWWLCGHCSSDDLIEAVNSLDGQTHRVICHTKDGHEPLEHATLVDLFKEIRRVARKPERYDEELPVSFIAASPGSVTPLPESEASRAVMETGSGILFRTVNPEHNYVLIPQSYTDGLAIWHWYSVDGHLVASEHYSPGDADALLSEAALTAEEQISSVPAAVPLSQEQAQLGHLLVGELTDHFDLIGVPDDIQPRAQRLMARADAVSAIIYAARQTPLESQLDPQLFPLMRAVRIARATAVDYALRELLRG